MPELKIGLGTAIIQIAKTRFDGIDYIGSPMPKHALVVPLIFIANRERLYAWLFLYRGYGFTTVGLDASNEDGLPRREQWALVGHSVDWEKHVPVALESFCVTACTKAERASPRSRNIILHCALNGDNRFVGVSDVTVRDSLGVVEVTYKE